MRFDFTDLRLFQLVVQTGSITRGAEHAHLALASAERAYPRHGRDPGGFPC